MQSAHERARGSICGPPQRAHVPAAPVGAHGVRVHAEQLGDLRPRPLAAQALRDRDPLAPLDPQRRQLGQARGLQRRAPGPVPRCAPARDAASAETRAPTSTTPSSGNPAARATAGDQSYDRGGEPTSAAHARSASSVCSAVHERLLRRIRRGVGGRGTSRRGLARGDNASWTSLCSSSKCRASGPARCPRARRAGSGARYRVGACRRATVASSCLTRRRRARGSTTPQSARRAPVWCRSSRKPQVRERAGRVLQGRR